MLNLHGSDLELTADASHQDKGEAPIQYNFLNPDIALANQDGSDNTDYSEKSNSQQRNEPFSELSNRDSSAFEGTLGDTHEKKITVNKTIKDLYSNSMYHPLVQEKLVEQEPFAKEAKADIMTQKKLFARIKPGIALENTLVENIEAIPPLPLKSRIKITIIRIMPYFLKTMQILLILGVTAGVIAGCVMLFSVISPIASAIIGTICALIWLMVLMAIGSVGRRTRAQTAR